MTDNNKALKNAGLKVTLPRLKILKYFKSLSATTSVRKISIKADRYGRRDRVSNRIPRVKPI